MDIGAYIKGYSSKDIRKTQPVNVVTDKNTPADSSKHEEKPQVVEVKK